MDLKFCPFRSTNEKTMYCDPNCALFIQLPYTINSACVFVKIKESLDLIQKTSNNIKNSSEKTANNTSRL